MMSRRDRYKARGVEHIVILDRGNVELGLPSGWTAEPQPDGYMKCKDAMNAVLLEVSYLRLPAIDPCRFPVAERLRLVMNDDPDAATHTDIVTFRRDDAEFAWADYAYESHDSERGRRRAAHGRWLIASNDLFQALLTYYYWTDDIAWAVGTWQAIIDTLHLGNGVPLETPKDHWSMRDDLERAPSSKSARPVFRGR
jgi:hypothetical protein